MGYTIWPDGPTGDVLQQVNAERSRQEELCRSGKFLHTCASETLSDERKLAVLLEEVGEAGKEVVELGIALDKARPSSELDAITARLRKELVQVAAVAVAWAESL